MIVFLLLILGFLWGSTFVLNKMLLDYFSVSFILTFRYAIASILFGGLFFRRIHFNRRSLRNGTIIGVINGLALVVQLFGLKYTTASNSGFITTTYILFLPIIELVVWKSKVGREVLAAIAVAFAGVYLLSFQDLTSFSFNIGDLITVGCGFLYAFQIFFIGHFTREENLFALVFVQFAVSAFLGTGYMALDYLISGTGVVLNHFSDPIVVMNVLLLSIAGTFVPISLQFYIQKRVSPTIAGVGYLMEPVFATMLAILFLGETLSLQSVIAMLLIFSSVLLVTLPGKKTEIKNLQNPSKQEGL